MRFMSIVVFLLLPVSLPAVNVPVPWSGDGNTPAREASITPLPFVFYSQFFEWTAGVYVRTVDLVQPNAQFDVVLFGSSNGTRYLYHQMRDFQVYGTTRLYFEPTVYFGKFGEIRAYTDMPGDWAIFGSTGEAYPGHNDSNADHYLTMSGQDQWYRGKFRYLLPIGHGTSSQRAQTRLERGRIVSQPAGGENWNPLLSGRTFLEIEPFYRKQVGTIIGGASFSVTRENWDYEDNPSRGSYQRIAFQRNPGSFGADSPWSIAELDLRWYLPLSHAGDDTPSILAFNFWTMDCITWNDSHQETLADGTAMTVMHRPPAFAAPALGSDTRFRAYYQNRFNDRAMAYAGAEYRQMIDWNPLEKLAVHWFQLAAFAEVGRVSPVWSPSHFAEEMKYSAGGGFRLMFTDLVLRMDLAFGNEDPMLQMFMAQSF
jgi:hypothetical protein